MKTHLAVIILLAIQFVDAWSTWQVYRFKVGYEGNGIVAYLIDLFGLYWGLFVAKGSVIAAVGYAQYIGAWQGTWATVFLFALIVVYVTVVANNLRILYGRR